MIKIAKVKLGPTAAQRRAERENDEERAHGLKPLAPILHLKTDTPGHPVEAAVADPEYEMPSFGKLRKRLIHLRQLVDIVLAMELDQDTIDVRRSVIEEIDRKGRIFLAQTSPPVMPSMIGKKIEMTFLIFVHDVPNGRWIRLGCKSKILDVIANFKLGPNYRETVIVVTGPTKFETSTTRLSHRVEPTADMDLNLRLLPKKNWVRLEDISVSGLSFRHTYYMSFDRGSTVRLALTSGLNTLVLNAKVIRTIERDNRMLSDTAVHFHKLKPKTKAQVQQLVTEMDRHILAMRSGLT